MSLAYFELNLSKTNTKVRDLKKYRDNLTKKRGELASCKEIINCSGPRIVNIGIEGSNRKELDGFVDEIEKKLDTLIGQVDAAIGEISRKISISSTDVEYFRKQIGILKKN